MRNLDTLTEDSVRIRGADGGWYIMTKTFSAAPPGPSPSEGTIWELVERSRSEDDDGKFHDSQHPQRAILGFFQSPDGNAIFPSPMSVSVNAMFPVQREIMDGLVGHFLLCLVQKGVHVTEVFADHHEWCVG